MMAECVRIRHRTFHPDDEGDEPLVVVRLIAGQHRRLRHASMRQQRRLNFAKLDAKAADLHLVVVPSEKLQMALGAPPHEVASSIHALAGGQRVRIG